MHPFTRLLILTLILAGAGCAARKPMVVEPPAVANSIRNQIGRLAVRGPGSPVLSLTADISSRGEAARNQAVSAGMGWLQGSFDAAGEAGDGGLLVAVFGLVTAPVIAAGGAVYGAAAADSATAIREGNKILEQALEFAPLLLEYALQTGFAEQLPVPYEFVDTNATNAELQTRGFDSVLDISLKTISSHPDNGGLQIGFETLQRATLTGLAQGRTLHSRIYVQDLPAASVSAWARDDASTLHAALQSAYLNVTQELVDEFFLEPSVRVRGLEPVSNNRFRVGSITGTVPLFVWSALDGRSGRAGDEVDYELAIKIHSADQYKHHFTTKPQLVLPDPLEHCRTYQWKVRARYESFGAPTESHWSPDYRFRTPCRG